MEIYLRARSEYKNFDLLVGALESHYSKAYWSKYARDLIHLTRIARNELRAYVGLPQLPMTLKDIAASFNDEESSIFIVGNEAPNCAVIGNSSHGIIFNVVVGGNGASVTSVLAKEVIKGNDQHRKHISIDDETFDQLNDVRLSKGISWKQFLMNLVTTNI